MSCFDDDASLHLLATFFFLIFLCERKPVKTDESPMADGNENPKLARSERLIDNYHSRTVK